MSGKSRSRRSRSAAPPASPSGAKKRLRKDRKWLAKTVTLIVIPVALLAAGVIISDLNDWVKSPSAPPPRTGPPVRVGVSAMQMYHNGTYVVPGKLLLTPNQLQEMTNQTDISAQAYQSWFAKRGGVQADIGLINLTLTSNYDSPVTVRELDIVKFCGKPLSGTLFQNQEGAGPFPIPAIDFNLDEGISIGQYGPPPGSGYPAQGGNFFDKEAISVSPKERPQILNVFVYTQSSYCKFYFWMHIATDKGDVTEKITYKGQQFQLTGTGSDFRTRNSRFDVVYAANDFTPPAHFVREK